MGFCPFFFRSSIKMLNRGLDKQELLRIVEAVANEKSIDKELVIDSMESAIQKAALVNLAMIIILKLQLIEKLVILKFKKF